MAASGLTALAAVPTLGIRATLAGMKDLTELGGKVNRILQPAWTLGTGSDQVDQVFESKEVDIAAGGGSVSYELDGGIMRNPLGLTIAFSKIKAVLIVNTGLAPFTFKGSCPFWRAAGATPANDEIIPVGGAVLHVHPAAGWAVGGAESIHMVNSGGSLGAFDIVLLGLEAP